MEELCSEHKNKLERICLHPQCLQRALCLLCDHPHGSPFKSIMVKTSESYKTFQSTINQSIDRHLLQEQSNVQRQIQIQQANMLNKYFLQVRKEMSIFLQQIERDIMKKLQSEDMQNFSLIKRARINKNYVNVPNNIFRILLEIYEGMPLGEIFKKNQSGKTEQAHHFLADLHNKIKEIMEERDFRLKVKMPDIRRVMLEEGKNILPDNETGYDLDMPKPKYQVKLVKQSEIDFDSIISDCQRMHELLITTSYDKKIRIVDERFELRAEHEYTNILTKIHGIADDVYAIGHSKELIIENIRYEEKELKVENIMRLRGHAEKINDIHSLNSRIVGSSSQEGVKLWDLYKEKCEYTLKDDANPTVIRFIPANSTLVVGYNSHHLKLYSVETLQLIKQYPLKGVPLLIDQGKFTQHQFYVGGFPSALAIVDTRLSKLASEFDLKQGGITTTTDSINDQQAVATGDRDGYCNVFDLRTKRPRIGWLAHQSKTSISKPRGIVGIFETQDNCWTTVGCNDRKFKLWEIENVQKQF